MYSWRVRVLFWAAIVAVAVLLYAGTMVAAPGIPVVTIVDVPPVMTPVPTATPMPTPVPTMVPNEPERKETTRNGWTKDDISRISDLVQWAGRGGKAKYDEIFSTGPPMNNPPTSVAVVALVGDPSKGEPKLDHGYLDALAVMAMNTYRYMPGYTPVLLMGPELYKTEWRKKVENIGWLTHPTPIPITHDEVQHKQFADALFKANSSVDWCDETCRAIYGGVGAWELAKLEAWRYPTQLPGGPYTHVILLDLDISIRSDLRRIFTEWLPSSATLGFTLGAYDGVGGEPLNGGFQILKLSDKSEADYHAMLQIVKNGGWRKGQGWGNGFGANFGGFNQQGLLPFYYMGGEGKGRAGLLPRCILNNMAMRKGCKEVEAASVFSNHFTGECHKPWQCVPIEKYHPQCQKFHATWWNDTSHLEAILQIPPRCPQGPTLALHGAKLCCSHTNRWPYMYDEIDYGKGMAGKLERDKVAKYFSK